MATQTSQQRDQDVDYFCVLDFEAVCEEEGPAPEPQEIIEFPTVALNARTLRTDDVPPFHAYVRPTVHPRLSAFCTRLTGITQATVDAAQPLDAVLEQHKAWMDTHFHSRNARYVFATCGWWDLQKCLPRECRAKGLTVPRYLGKGFVNVKVPFQAVVGCEAGGMVHMLQTLGIPLRGRHHSGIDDATNIAAILAELVRRGYRYTLPAVAPAATQQQRQQRQQSPKQRVEVPKELRDGLLACATAEIVAAARDQVKLGNKCALIAKASELATQAFLQSSPEHRAAFGNASLAVCTQLQRDLSSRIASLLDK